MIDNEAVPVENTPQGNAPYSKNRWLTWFMGLIGPVLFIWILTHVNIPQIWIEIRQINLFWLAGFVIMVVPLIMVRAWRLRMVLGCFGLKLTNPQSLLIRWVGTAAGDLLPARVGELISVAYLHQVGYGVGDPTLAIVLDRLFDMIWMAIWAVSGLAVMGGTLRENFNSVEWALALFTLVMIIAIVSLVVLRKHPGRMFSLLKRLLPKRWATSGMTLLRGTHHRSFTLTPAQITLIMAVSLLSVVILILRVYMLVFALDLNISLPFLAACLGIATLVQLIPINNMFGIGTRDVTLVYLFGLGGVPAEQALSFSLLVLASVIFQDLIGLLLWWRYPIGTPFMRKPGVPADGIKSI